MAKATMEEKYKKLMEKHTKLVAEGHLAEEREKKLQEEKKKVITKHNKLVASLRANVECPVCLGIPTEGLMASCPRGHIVCLSCHRIMVAQGMLNCPNCREVMGNNMNLLAKTVIENIDHECTNEGCNKMLSQQEVLRHKEFLCIFRKVLCPLNPGCMQMVAHKDVVKHTEEFCEYRMVLCPGNSSLCKATLSFGALNDHFKVCTSIGVGFQGTSSVMFSKDLLDRETANIKTKIFRLNDEVFAVQTKMKNSNMSFGVLMLANREKCERFKVTIEIQDDNSETAFLAQFNPDPVDMKNSDEASLVVHKTKLAKMVTSDEDKFRYKVNMKVSEKRSIAK